MFYHDHAYGITRLNVYAGEAAGYLLTDSAEEGLINAGILPNAGGVYRYGIPLIIQDKTFVPNDVAIQDAKWNTTNWGQPGDLWFPHVYEANQDPNSEDGTNPFGRWDYGPWFWPPVIVAADKATLPDPSITPEAFMDTPLVNGAAYPFLPVAAYGLPVPDPECFQRPDAQPAALLCRPGQPDGSQDGPGPAEYGLTAYLADGWKGWGRTGSDVGGSALYPDRYGRRFFTEPGGDRQHTGGL